MHQINTRVVLYLLFISHVSNINASEVMDESKDLQDPYLGVVTTENTFTAYDCSQPREVTDTGFLTNPSCMSDSKVSSSKKVTYQVIQREKYHRVAGYVCEMTLTEEAFYCGAYDHMTKLTHLCFYNLPLAVSTVDCNDWVRNLNYRDSNGNNHRLELNSVNFIKYEKKGRTYASGGQVSCEGQEMKFNDQILQQMVLDAQVTIIIRHETYKLGLKEVIAHTQDQRLSCLPSEGGCETPLATYIWTAPVDSCELAYVRTTSGLEVTSDKEETVFMSTDGSLVRLIKKEDFSECNRIVYRTNHEGIYLYDLTKKGKEFGRKVEAGEISMATYVKSRDDFLFNHVADAVESGLQKVLRSDCQSKSTQTRSDFYLRHKDPGMTTWTQGEGQYSTTAGDITYNYKCKAVQVQGLSKSICYDALPVALIHDGTSGMENKIFQGKTLYLEPLTHRLTMQAVEIPCLKRFPSKYRNSQGDWIAVLPHLFKASAPLLPEDFKEPGKIFANRPDFSTNGIYDDEEINAMEEYQESSRTVMVLGHTLARQIGDREVRNEGRYYHADQVFPELRDPRQWAKSAWTKTLSYLHLWGETAAIFISMFTVYRIVAMVLRWVLGLVLLRDVHGCTRELFWTPCPGMFLLKQYREFNRHPTTETTAKPSGPGDVEAKGQVYGKVYPQGQIEAAKLAQEAQARAQENQRVNQENQRAVKRLAPQPFYTGVT